MRNETGRLVNAGTENQYVDVQGTFSYTDTNGKLVEINYHADENGYHVLSHPVSFKLFYINYLTIVLLKVSTYGKPSIHP